MTVCGKTVAQMYDQLFNFITKKHHKSLKQLKSYNCEIPEITHNYKEFQDPVIGTVYYQLQCTVMQYLHGWVTNF